MNKFDKMLYQKAAEEKITMPEYASQKLEETLAALPPRSEKRSFTVRFTKALAVPACLLFVLLFVMPNVSTAYAAAMEKVPVLGELIQVVTIRNYWKPNENHEMNISAPNIPDASQGSAEDYINKDVDQMVKGLIRQFYDNLELDGDEGHGSIYVDYNIVTNTERWFTLKLSVHTISGSSSSYYAFRHVDRQTGKCVQLGDIFQNDSFSEILTENIKQQMRLQIQENPKMTYWIDDEEYGFDFPPLSSDHNFYFNEEGNLVIPFDKYEVAPGFMGCPEFVIDREIVLPLLKPEYAGSHS